MSSEREPPRERQGTYRAVVEEYEGRPDQCTIFPRDVSETDRLATWITARDESFVRLDKMR